MRLFVLAPAETVKRPSNLQGEHAPFWVLKFPGIWSGRNTDGRCATGLLPLCAAPGRTRTIITSPDF